MFVTYDNLFGPLHWVALPFSKACDYAAGAGSCVWIVPGTFSDIFD